MSISLYKQSLVSQEIAWLLKISWATYSKVDLTLSLNHKKAGLRIVSFSISQACASKHVEAYHKARLQRWELIPFLRAVVRDGFFARLWDTALYLPISAGVTKQVFSLFSSLTALIGILSSACFIRHQIAPLGVVSLRGKKETILVKEVRETVILQFCSWAGVWGMQGLTGEEPPLGPFRACRHQSLPTHSGALRARACC